MKLSNTWKFIISIIICEGFGSLGAIFTTSSISTWYATLQKPVFNPPNWLFAPAWTILFFLIGVALYYVWINYEKKKYQAQIAIKFFVIQFILNVLWSLFFFGFRDPGLALVEIMVLWIFILITYIKFYHIDKRAGYYLIPYLAWVTFAAALNFSIWYLN